jgi:hypothetical protein
MPKQSPSNPERSKVRIFFVEGDFAPGDLQNLTQALTSAIRPAPLVVRGSPARLAAPVADSNGNGVAEIEAEPAEAELTDETEPEVPATSAKGPTRPRKYRKPKPVDIDMNAGGKPFVEFAKEKAPGPHRAKYLVVAAWLHDYANIKTITPDHVYTCYQVADWTFDVVDPALTLRQLANDGRGEVKKSQFTINHVGLADVKKMNASTTGS